MKRFSIFFFLIFINALSKAELPVIDPAALIELKNQIQHLKGLKDLNQQSLKQLIAQQKSLTGSYGFGTQGHLNHLFNWGSNANRFQSSLNLYQSGSGALGGTARRLHGTFPIESIKVAHPNPQHRNAKYYHLRAKTVLIARAASEATYDEIERQFKLLDQLQKKIDATENIKSAMDLQNRLILENSRTQLQMLRLISIMALNQAMDSQGEVNAVVHQFNVSK